jgi:hypothetical protein
MYYRQVSIRSDLTININYYLENKFGIDMVKTHINITNSLSVVVVFLKHEDHPLINYLFIEQDVRDAMINHFHIQA